MTHRRVEMRVAVDHALTGRGAIELATTLHLPDGGSGKPPCVIFAFPGGGYARSYLDLRSPGHDSYSQAEHHVAAGAVLIAIHHVGIGESTHPKGGVTLEEMADANAAAVRELVARLGAGTLDAALPALADPLLVGLGQSMGGFLVVMMQARHRPFDMLAVLGASMRGTTFPQRAGAPGNEPDFRYAFHSETTPAELI